MKPKDFVKISSSKSNRNGFSYGEKGLRLLEISTLGFNVPDGVLLSCEFLERMVNTLEITDRINHIQDREHAGETELFNDVVAIFNGTQLGESFKKQLEDEIKTIKEFKEDTLFAVRSSAIGEDSETSSFAGQYSTFLNVNFNDIWNAIYHCYASWWTSRAIIYRKENNITESYPKISILIQKQINSHYSGVLFTRHPFKRKNRIVIEAVKGLGEKLVSGEITPAKWEIDPHTKKTVKFLADPKKEAANFSKKHLLELINISQKLEENFHKGLDIEWALENHQLYILQMRPITTLNLHPTVDNLTEGTYSRTIVEDLWSDCMTHITSSIIFDEMRDLYTFKVPLKKLKLNHIADIPAINIFHQYAYLNSKVVVLLLEYIPPFLRLREIQNVFPSAIRKLILETPFRLKKLLKVLFRLPLLLDDVALIPFLTIPLLKKHLKKIEYELNRVDVLSYRDQPLDFYRNELERLLTLLSRLQIKNQWGYGNATVFTWMLYHVSTQMFGFSEEWVLKQMQHIPDNNTLNLQRRIQKISSLCKEKEILTIFQIDDKKEAWKILETEYRNHPVTRLIEQFISDFRYRSSNRDFIHPRWDEDVTSVLELIAIVINSNDKHGVSQNTQKEKTHVGFVRRILYIPLVLFLVRITKRFLALREDLRYGLDKVFYRIRKLLLAINEHDSLRFIKEIPDGIFFIELHELRELLEEKMHIKTLLPVIQKRATDYYQQMNQSPPYYIKWQDGELIDLGHKDETSEILKGIAASPGIVRGHVKIIHSDKEFHKLKKGDILVAYNTDPGWTPLFLSAKGVIVEMGGILNHCAIVAREYGVPAIVGLKSITQRLTDGQYVQVNGNTGVLEILD